MGMFGMFGLFGVVTTVVVVGASFFFLFRVLGSLSQGEKQRQRLLQIGVPAQARILQVTMGGMTVTTGVHRQLQLQLALEVRRPGMAPYQAVLTTLVSELQIPQVQPGVWIGVRIDPQNPQSMAIEALGVAPPGTAAAPQPAYGPPGYGAPQPGYGPPGMAAAPQPGYGPPGYGAPPGMGVPVAPMGGFKLPMGAKIGIGIGIAGAVLGIGASVVAVGWTSGIGGPSDTCKKAAACCRKMAGSNPSASSCDNYTKQSGPIADTVCEQSLKSFRQSGSCK